MHRAFEAQFWGTKMALKGFETTEALGSTKEAMEAFLRDEARLARATELAAVATDPEQKKVLACFTRTFSCYQMKSPAAVALREESTALENALNKARNTMALGYRDPKGGDLVEKSSVGLRTLMRTADDEKLREAAWGGLRSIGPFVLDDFCEMVKLRSAPRGMTRSQGSSLVARRGTAPR